MIIVSVVIWNLEMFPLYHVIDSIKYFLGLLSPRDPHPLSSLKCLIGGVKGWEADLQKR